MRYSKRYIALTLALVVIFTVQFHVLELDRFTVGQFRGAVMAQEVWNPIVADEVNSNVIKLVIDNKEYSSEDYTFYMNENRDIMVPVTLLRDALNCSAHLYEQSSLLVEKYNSVADFVLDNPKVSVNDEKVEVDSPLTCYKGKYYIAIEDVSQFLGYNVSFNISTYTLSAADTSETSSIVPAKYDLREKGRVSQVRNQGAYGTCWAFAAMSALESTLLPERPALFSVDHMTMCNSFNSNQYDGGEYTMGMAYLAAWQGPVYEADDPYGDDVTDDTLKSVMHVQQMQIIDGKDFQGIKEAVFKYGGVQSSLYSNMTLSNSSTMYYNSQKQAYCYIGTEKPNHDIVIVGWDDNYSKENFNIALEGDGAFICQNSWGDKFGDQGFFYVSYYDTNIGTHNIVYTQIEDTDNYDHIYQSDLCGWVGKLGYDAEDMYGANVYTAQNNENVEAAGFYATGANTEYELYFVKNFTNTYSFDDKVKVASGKLDKAGYYTISFEEPVAVNANERYAVVLYVKTPGSAHPMAIEYNNGNMALSNVNLEDGEGYISYSGLRFTNVKEKQDCNLCIKAFSTNR